MASDSQVLADFSAAEFVTPPKTPHTIQQGVMPVVAMRGNQYRPLGTAFAISSQGILLTARHVVDEGLNFPGGWGPKEALRDTGDWTLGVLYVREPLPGEQLDTDLFGGFLPGRAVHMRSDLDIAALTVELPINVDTGEPVRLLASRLSPGLPAVGSHCFAVGYHSMRCQTGDPADDGGLAIHQSLSVSRGQVEALHVPRRDAFNLPFPCFQCSARFDGGMSGGPVIGDNGAVIGVVCSSFGTTEAGGHTSYASLIAPALMLEIEATTSHGDRRPRRLIEFVEGGAVATDATLSQVAITMAESKAKLHFLKPLSGA